MELLGTIYFPVSGVHTWVFLPPLVAFFLAFFGAMAGVTGAFLLLPFQMSVLGYTAPGVSATNLCYNLWAIPFTVWRYARQGRVNWPLALLLSAGSIPGMGVGYLLRVFFLANPSCFKPFAGLVLLYLAYRLARDLSQKRSSKGPPPQKARIKVKTLSWRCFAFEFSSRLYRYDPRPVFLVSFLVGIAGGAYGIGGGAVLAPYCLTVLRLPVYTVAGASLLATFLSSVAGVLVYTTGWVAHGLVTQPDFWLGTLFGVGGLVGGYLGAKTQGFIPERPIKWGLLLVIVLVVLKYLGPVLLVLFRYLSLPPSPSSPLLGF